VCLKCQTWAWRNVHSNVHTYIRAYVVVTIGNTIVTHFLLPSIHRHYSVYLSFGCGIFGETGMCQISTLSIHFRASNKRLSPESQDRVDWTQAPTKALKTQDSLKTLKTLRTLNTQKAERDAKNASQCSPLRTPITVNNSWLSYRFSSLCDIPSSAINTNNSNM